MPERPNPTPDPSEPDTAWSAARWQPDPDADPLPVQPYASDPLVPGWGVAEPSQSPAPIDDAVPGPAIPPVVANGNEMAAGGKPLEDPSETGDTADQPIDEPPAADAPPAASERTMIWVAAGAVVLGVLVFLAIVVGQRVADDTVGQQLSSLPGVRIGTQLVAAGRAMDMYRQQNGAYATDLGSLADYGFEPASDVTVQLVPIAGAGFCLAGGPVGDSPTAWYSSSTEQVVHTPCQ